MSDPAGGATKNAALSRLTQANKVTWGLSKNQWRSRWGFYLVAISSGCGLGNLWRFPYVAGENGGGAFLLLYLFLAFSVGLVLMIGELFLGKVSGRSLSAAVGFLKDQEQSHSAWLSGLYKGVPFLGLFLCIGVLSYYSVVSGWVLHFVVHFLLGVTKIKSIQSEAILPFLLDHGWLQVLLASLHLLLVFLITHKGVQEGTERWVSFMVPLFLLFLLILCLRSLSLPSAKEALRFFLYPDLTKLNSASLLTALGQVLFSLSIGFGMMCTFGSYMDRGQRIPEAALLVTWMDVIISVMAGLLIFPILFSAGMSGEGVDSMVFFKVLPPFFVNLDGWGIWFGLLFFLFLYVAALNASIGLLEVVAANLTQVLGWARVKSARRGALFCLLLALLPALSSSLFKDMSFFNHSVLQLLDYGLIHVLLPVMAFLLVILLTKLIKQREQLDLEFQGVDGDKVSEEFRSEKSGFREWIFLLKYWVPLVVIMAFFMLCF